MAAMSYNSRHKRFQHDTEDDDSDNGNNSTKQGTQFGRSLQGTNLSKLMMNHRSSTVVGIQVINLTKFHLIQPNMITISGYVSTPAVSISPGHTEAMIAHRKYEASFVGSSGMVSWLIQDTDRRLVIVWKSPLFLSNTLGIGLTNVGYTTQRYYWNEDIRKNKENKELISKYMSFGKMSEEIMIENDCFKVCGSMGSSSKPEVKVTFGMK
ncbi:conoporin-Cn1-like [Mytilus galloprovincialis]|uniref:conoporin-Cn1-like n=1 Tax=Mytilus galloprovincialis TaxID=29158 RepID=UPI003F7CBF76